MALAASARVRDEQEWNPPQWLRMSTAVLVVLAMLAASYFSSIVALLSMTNDIPHPAWVLAATGLALGTAPVGYWIGRSRLFLVAPLVLPMVWAIVYALEGN